MVVLVVVVVGNLVPFLANCFAEEIVGLLSNVRILGFVVGRWTCNSFGLDVVDDDVVCGRFPMRDLCGVPRGTIVRYCRSRRRLYRNETGRVGWVTLVVVAVMVATMVLPRPTERFLLSGYNYN